MFDIVLILFVLISLGVIASKSGIFSPENSRHFSRYVFYVSVPCLILHLFGSTNVIAKIKPEVLAINLIPTVLIVLLFYFIKVVFKPNPEFLCMSVLAVIMPSSVFVGFPVVEVLYGEEGLALATIIGPLHLIFTMLVGIPLIEVLLSRSRGGLIKSVKKIAKHPLIIVIVLGVLLNLFDVRLPDVFLEPLGNVGSSTTPVALFAMGLFMGGIKLNTKKLKNAFTLSLLRLSIYPVLILLLYPFIQIAPASLAVSVLLAMMPVAIFSFVLSMEYGLDSEAMSIAILITTLLVPLPIYLVTSAFRF